VFLNENIQDAFKKTTKNSLILNPMKSSDRLFYFDNIRWLVIVFVVIEHLCVTYDNMGSWFYKEPATLDAFSFLIFGMIGSFLEAFFMGLLFFIAGYFSVSSLEKKGTNIFLKDRFIRLGIPTLIFMLILSPLTNYIILFFSHKPFFSYVSYLASFKFLSESGPLWFALALLGFSIVYAFVNLFIKNRKKDKKYVLKSEHLILLIIILSVFTFLFRIFWSVGANAFMFYNLQLGKFAQYIILFSAGIFAFKNNLLENVSYNLGKLWLKLALSIGIPVWMILLAFGGALKGNVDPFFGGIHWQSAAYALWESFFCVAISVGLLGIFRKKYNSQGMFTNLISKNAFGVYVFHPPIIVFIAMLFSGLIMYPLLKMVLMALICIPICFLLVYFIRKIPICEKLFS
jgi:glucans biosynthesis protein C